MRIAFLLLVGVCNACALSAQNVWIDSLEHILSSRKLSSTERIEVLNDLSREYIYVDPLKSSTFAQEALRLSIESANLRGEAYAYRNIAANYSNQEYFLAFTYLIEKSMSLFESLGDSIGLANCYISLGNTYGRQRDYAKAVLQEERALRIFRNAGLKERSAVSMSNLAYNLMLNGELERARRVAEEAIALLEEAKKKDVLSALLRTRGITHFRQGHDQQAEADFLHVLRISGELQKYSQKEATTEALLGLAELAHLRGNASLQGKYLAEAKAYAQQNDNLTLLREALLRTVEHHVEEKNLAEADRTLDEYRALSDSIDVRQSKDKAAMLEPVLEAMKMAIVNEQLKLKSADQQRLIESKNRQIWWYAVAVVLLGSVVAMFYYSNRQRKRYAYQLLLQKHEIEKKSLELSEANTLKDKFFSIISHDLRSPLNSLQSFIMLLNDHWQDLSTEEIKKLIATLTRDLTNTIALTDNLIMWAKVQMSSTPPEKSVVDLRDTLHGIMDLFRESCKRKQVQIISSECAPLHIFANAHQLQFVLRNLVHNAVKFAPFESKIQIRCSVEHDQITIAITNQGDPIPDEVRANLFVLGKVRSSKGTAGEKGTGLGLVLVKEFVEKNDGAIDITSTAVEGTTFSLRFQKVTTVSPDHELQPHSDRLPGK